MDGWAVAARDRQTGEVWLVPNEGAVDQRTAEAEVHCIPVTATDDTISLGYHEPATHCVCRPHIEDGIVMHEDRRPN